jgi:membrane-associated protein
MDTLFNIPQIIGNYGYIGIFIIVFLESGLFFALPGDSLLFTAGLLVPIAKLNIFTLIIVVFISAYTGGIVGYYLGTYVEKLNRYKFFKKIVKQEYLDRSHAFLEKHGMYAMISSRFLPIVRTFLPVVAGMVKMEYQKFIQYSFLGSLVWTLVFTLSGYFLGRVFPGIEKYILYVAMGIVIITILPFVFQYLKGKIRK